MFAITKNVRASSYLSEIYTILRTWDTLRMLNRITQFSDDVLQRNIYFCNIPPMRRCNFTYFDSSCITGYAYVRGKRNFVSPDIIADSIREGAELSARKTRTITCSLFQPIHTVRVPISDQYTINIRDYRIIQRLFSLTQFSESFALTFFFIFFPLSLSVKLISEILSTFLFINTTFLQQQKAFVLPAIIYRISGFVMRELAFFLRNVRKSAESARH